MYGNRYDYLKVNSSTGKLIVHTGNKYNLILLIQEEYIKEGRDSIAIRRIYKNVEYDIFEKE